MFDEFSQGTLDEILAYYKDYTLYLCEGYNQTSDNETELFVVDSNDRVAVVFESIGYEDDDCTPDVYEISESCPKIPISWVLDRYAEDYLNCTITKLQGGIK